MEVTNCKDINGNDITELELRSDGTVWSVLDGADNSKVSYDCCTSNGFDFDPNDAMCYWNNTCELDSNYKIVLNAEGNSGSIFQVDTEDDCTLEIEFDYLIKLKCNEITNLSDILTSIKIGVSLEKEVYDETLPIPNNLESVLAIDLINITSIPTFLDGNTETGLSLEGDGCDALVNGLITDLGATDSQSISLLSFNSAMVTFKYTVTDTNIIDLIKNERIKLVLIANNLEKYSVLLDNVKLNRLCETQIAEDYVDENDCPSFSLTRVIDNKKSWVKNEEYENRKFNVSRRGTSYNANNERLVINTKEVDLLLSSSTAIESDVWSFVNTNPCILEPMSGCTSGTSECIDITELMTTPLTELNNGSDLLKELVDAKSFKVTDTYPTVELFYYRYLNSEAHCGIINEVVDNNQIDEFVDLIGNFWSDMIEQVVPATTIWGRSNQFSNSVFGSSKYKYRKSTLLLCTDLKYDAPSPVDIAPEDIEITSGISVTTTDITDTGYFGPPELAPVPASSNCNGVSVIQMDMGSEFIGSIIVIGEDTGNVISGNTFTINETISDECDTYYKECEIMLLDGDFSHLDFNPNDWLTPIS